MIRMARKGLYLTLVWPVERSLLAVRGVGRNGVIMGRMLRRGVTTTPRKHAPVMQGMSADDVSKLDRWWKSLSQDERERVWQEHDAWLVQTAQEAEKNGEGIWSLTEDLEKRREALKRQRLGYYFWMTMSILSSTSLLLVSLFGDVAPLFWLSSLCFIAFIAPHALSYRVTRGQLLYGRKISYREFLSPLPSALQQPKGSEDGTSLPAPSTVSPALLEAREAHTARKTDHEG